MKRRNPETVFLLSLTLTWTMKLASSLPTNKHFCNRTCGSRVFQYPFGFSDACQIRLNCTAAGDPVLPAGGEFQFPIQSVSSESIRLGLRRKCDRPLVAAVESLFGQNYAPTSRNAMLLENCSDPGPPCEIPSILVQTHFSSLPCGGGKSEENNESSISCYSEKNATAFMNPRELRRRRCGFLLSSISVNGSSESPVSLAVEVLELGWWVVGRCGCDRNANCTYLKLPMGGRGFRCHCHEGFSGDGFRGGFGCRKEFPKCNLARFLSGKCGGARVITLVGVIGVAVSVSTSVAVMTWCLWQRRAKHRAQGLTKRRLWEATGNLNIPTYPYKDMERATEGFSEKHRLGTGAYGTVYAGKVGGEWVAIKRIRQRDSVEQVVNEMKLISSIQHPNLVRLLGCSVDNGEQILVYEFMPNGTLSQHLQRERGEGLPWLLRLTIALQTAQAIAHLHSHIIYHRDIKSSNILLDHHFTSKLADFGLSRLGISTETTSHISTAPQGTPGYLDPQYHHHFHLSDKSDVYSFGVVLAEIITGMKAVDFSRPPGEVNLATLAADRIGRGCVDEIVDPSLFDRADCLDYAWTLLTVRGAAELAFRCLAFHREARPSMMEVTAELERLRRSRSSPENGDLMVEIGGASFDESKEHSPISVQDVWLSEQSSPSSLLRNSLHLSY